LVILSLQLVWFLLLKLILILDYIHQLSLINQLLIVIKLDCLVHIGLPYYA
jgi:hypothetical protein